MLRDLGHDGPKRPRDPSQESAREAKLVALIDAEVESLVAARRVWQKSWLGFAAAAAILALTLGLRHARTRPASLAIAPEPISRSTSKAGPPPRLSEPAALGPSAAVSVAEPNTPPRPSTPSALVAPLPPASVERQSTLAEENQLFKEAAEADRKGDVKGAISRLDRLVVEHPASPLAQTAMVRKFRLLAKAGRVDEARREAELYLATYPTGFAVSEAQALKAESAAPSPP